MEAARNTQLWALSDSPSQNINNLIIIIIIIIIDTCTIPCTISRKIHCLLDYLIQKIPSTEHHLAGLSLRFQVAG